MLFRSLAVGQMLVAAWNQLNQHDLLVVLCPDGTSRDSLAKLLHRHWIPQATLAVRTVTDSDHQSPLLDHLFRSREFINGQPTLYHCTGDNCLAPVVGLDLIEKQLEALGGRSLSRTAN